MRKLLWALINLLFIYNVYASDYELGSPNGKMKAEIGVADKISVILKKEGNVVLKLDNLSMNSHQDITNESNYKVRKVLHNSMQETIRPPIREKAEIIQNHYNELEIQFRNKWRITFRLFDEGLAYRLSTSQKDSLTIYSENIELLFDENDSVWMQPSESFNSSYETPYEHQSIIRLQQGQLCHLPLLVEKVHGPYVLVTEADLYNYPGLWFNGTGEARLAGTNPPYPKQFRYTGNIYQHGQILETYDYIAKVGGDRSFPWRIFAVADNEKDLIDNNMVYLLSSPGALDDHTWIRPGVVMFDWWAKYNIYGVDFNAGINTQTAKYFIDFCAEYGFQYFLFDDGWSLKDDLLNPVPDLDIAEVTSYAQQRGVGVMLWVFWNALEKQWEEAFDLFEEWGIQGIKMDFMNRDDQKMVEFYEAVAKKAAEKRMIVNFHGAYKPAGLRRKYPNVLTREGLIEFEYNGWTDHDNPKHHNLLPYIRMVTGPMDYIPGTMRNSTKGNFRALSDYPMGQGTRAHAMALFVILNSPMTMLPDSPSDYYRENECTEFLAEIPVEWNETRLLKGEIAEYTVLARRSGNEWYIGAITNWDSRTLEINTEFLGPGKFLLKAIEDGVNANQRAEDYKMYEDSFSAGDTLQVNLASGGGWVARIIPVE